MDVSNILEYLKTFLLGPFLISFVSNSIPFISLPYLLVIIGFAFKFTSLHDRILVVFFSALGASLGKILIYFIGKGFSKFLGQSSKKNLELFNKIASKSLPLAIFVFAALPLPDDVLYLPLGLSGFSLLTYFISVFLGKLFLKSLVVFYGSLLILAGEELGYHTIPAFIALSILFSYYVIKIDWSKVIKAHMEGGLKKSVACLMLELSLISRKLIVSIKAIFTLLKKLSKIVIQDFTNFFRRCPRQL
ncbi:MAG: VTT domain-containing protein [Desulfurococcaceae archaeon TW002]